MEKFSPNLLQAILQRNFPKAVLKNCFSGKLRKFHKKTPSTESFLVWWQACILRIPSWAFSKEF